MSVQQRDLALATETGQVPPAAGWPRWHRFPRVTTVLALLVLVIVAAWALAPGLFAPGDPIAGDPAAALRPPGADHWFGTDETGRDVFGRVVHGAANSLSSAVIAVTVGLIFGTAIGLVAGSVGGWVDAVLMRVVDVLLAIPSLLLSLSVIILLGFGTINVAIAVGVTSVAAFARLSRAEAVRVWHSDYVEAAFGSGGRFHHVLVRHVLPNAFAPVLALAALQSGSAILQIATLGFLGYGAAPPYPEWGLMIAEGRNYVGTAWWLTSLPGLVLVVVVLATNALSSAISPTGRR